MMSEVRTPNWGRWIVISAAVAAWSIYDMATATEAPSQTLALMQYVLLAGTLFGLVVSVVKYTSGK